MANLKKEEEKNKDRRDRNATSRSCIYNHKDAPRSPRQGPPPRQLEARQDGPKRMYQDPRHKSMDNRRFAWEQPGERHEFKFSRGIMGPIRNDRDHPYKNRTGHNNKRPYLRKQELTTRTIKKRKFSSDGKTH